MTTTRPKYISYLTIAIFVLFISLPSLQSLWEQDSQVSKKEKRNLASLPDADLLFKDQQSLREAFDAYINDHIGFRDVAIVAHSAIKIKLFGVSPNQQALLGKDKWIYHAGYNSQSLSTISDFRGRYQLSTETLNSWYLNHMALVHDLNRKGIKYVAVVVPNKQSIHPEYLPDRVRSSAGFTILDQLSRHISNKPVDGLLNLKTGLLELRKDGDVYRRADTHWNQKGYLYAYQNIINYLRPDISGIGRPLEKEDMLKTVRSKIGDLSLLVGLPDYFLQSSINYQPREACDTKGQKISLTEIGYTTNQYAHIYTCANRTAKLMFIHDSFGAPLLPLLTEHFGKTFSSRFGNVSELKNYVDQFQPDVVVHLRSERELQSLFTYDEEMLFQYHVDSFQNRIKDVVSLDLSYQNLTITGGSGSNDRNRLTIDSTTNDPNIIFPVGQLGQPGTAFTMRLVITAPSRDRAIVYYTSANSPSYSEDKRVEQVLKPGENVVFIRIVAESKISGIRLDPGRQPGAFTIASVSLLHD